MSKIGNLKIAMVCPERFPMPPREGFLTAVELWVEEVSRVLAMQDRVSIFSIKDKISHSLIIPKPDNLSYCYTPVSLIDTTLLRIPNKALGILSGSHTSYWQSSFYYAFYALRLASKIRKERFDVVHLHNILQFAPWIRRLAPDTTLLFHMHWHGLSKRDYYFGYGVFDDTLARKWLDMVDIIIGVSSYLVTGIIDRFPEVASKCQTLINGTNIDRFKPLERQDFTPSVVYSGRIVPEKGVHLLMKAMKQVRLTIPEAKLRIIGESWRPGTNTDLYWEQVNKLSLELGDCVEFLGWKTRSQLPSVLAENDIFVHPPLWEEPCSMAIIEAMSNGLPVITTTTGGNPELVKDGETGLLVTTANIEELANAIIRLLKDDKTRKIMGQKSRERAIRHFSWETVTNNLRKIYSMALDSRLQPEERALLAQHDN